MSNLPANSRKSNSEPEITPAERSATVRDVARGYISKGWKPVQIPIGRKSPKDMDWQNDQITLENVGKHFDRWHTNIGVQFGKCSNGLGDVDLDCAEARALAEYFLPETGAVFGRKSSPRSHWLYATDLWETAKRASTPFEDPIRPAEDAQDEHGVMLVELRTGRIDKKGQLKGAVSLFPPSIHTSGQLVSWYSEGEPAQLNGDELKRHVAKLAAATLLVRHYPSEGKRHDAALVLGGWLARAGWDESGIARFVEAVARTAVDGEWRERVRTAKSAVRKLAQDDSVPGFPRMRKLFDGKIVDALADWLDITGDSTSARDNSYGTAPSKQASKPEPRTIGEVVAVFNKWLLLKNLTPVYAMLGAVAANLLPGDPIWLGLVASPSSAKTELLNATTKLSYVVPSSVLTLGALLSGVPQKQYAHGAKGGLLRQIGEFGILMHKDFTSVLSMHGDARNELLAALREIFDGAWTRHIGTDGGRALSWAGKLGMLFGVTGVIDQHHGVIGSMGDRFLLCRLQPKRGQLRRALDHVGPAGKEMRKELAEAVAGLFAAPLGQPRDLSEREIDKLEDITDLVVRLRGAVVRDGYTKEIEAVMGEEGTGRIGLMLERLLAGLDTLGVDRDTAFRVVRTVAFDSVPPHRLDAYRYLRITCEGEPATTREIAKAIRLPTSTTRRRLDELAAYGLVKRLKQGGSKGDSWKYAPSS